MAEQTPNLGLTKPARSELYDVAVANENMDKIDSELGNTLNDLNMRGISPQKFGAVGDGVTDDTAALQETIDYCIENNLPLAFNGRYAVSGISINDYLKLAGYATLLPVSNNQEYILNISNKVDWDGKLLVDGQRKALAGVIGSNIINSHISSLEIINCKAWGLTFDTKGNNAMVTVDFFRAGQNGSRHTTTFTQTSFQNSPDYSTISLSTPIDSNLISKHYNILFVFINNRPYKIKSIIDNKTLEIYHANIPSGDIQIFIGGGLNIRSYGDNGVGNWGTVNLFANTGIGVNMSGLYGHSFSNFVAQGNGIGMACEDQTFGVNLNKPYFEVNVCDIVVFNYIRGTMYNPIIDYNKIFALTNYNVYGYDDISQLNIIDQHKNLNMSTSNAIDNPSGVILYPTKSYFFTLSNIRSSMSLKIQNDSIYNKTNSEYINLTLNFGASADVTFTLVNENGDTIQGGTSYTVHVRGKSHVIITKIAGDWRVTVLEAKETRSNPPVQGIWKIGDVIYNTAPKTGGYIGWVCVENGTPGIWKGFGLIES